MRTWEEALVDSQWSPYYPSAYAKETSMPVPECWNIEQILVVNTYIDKNDKNKTKFQATTTKQ